MLFAILPGISGETDGIAHGQVRRNPAYMRSSDYDQRRALRLQQRNAHGDDEKVSAPRCAARKRIQSRRPNVEDRLRSYAESGLRCGKECRRLPPYSGKRWRQSLLVT